MRAVLAVIVLLAFAGSSAAGKSASSASCGNIITKYYSWAALKQFPPRPTNLESAAWAQDQERHGRSHYIAEFCENGEIHTLTKRLHQKVFFRYEYIYERGKLVAYRVINQQGKEHIVNGK